jgi:hypothetical protein
LQHSDLLQTFAEIAAAFAGFASLISVLGRSAEFIDSSRLLGMVRTSLIATGFALFPFVPVALGVPEATAWRFSAGLLFVVSGTHTFFTWQKLYHMWTKGVFRVRVGYFTFPMGAVQLLLAASACLTPSPARAAGLYVASVAGLLSISGVLFLGVFTSFILRRDAGSAPQLVVTADKPPPPSN